MVASVIYSCSKYTFCLFLAVRSISKDGSILCECTHFTVDVSVPVEVQCELILSKAASFNLFFLLLF